MFCGTQQTGPSGHVGENNGRRDAAAAARCVNSRSNTCYAGCAQHLQEFTTGLRAAGAASHARPRVWDGLPAGRLAASPHFLELVGFFVQASEGIQRLSTVVHLAEAAIEAGQHVIIRRCTGIERDGAVHGIDRIVQMPLLLVSLSLLKPGPVGFGIEFERFVRVFEGFLGLGLCGCNKR